MKQGSKSFFGCGDCCCCVFISMSIREGEREKNQANWTAYYSTVLEEIVDKRSWGNCYS